jgi:hypothetical protein
VLLNLVNGFSVANKFKQVADNLRTYANEKAVEETLLQIIREDEFIILELLQEQLQNSLDGNNEPLGEYASISYANKKGRITIDLKLTGDWYNSQQLNAESFPVTITATDEKNNKLIARFGPNILKLAPQYLSQYLEGRFRTRSQDYFRSLFQVQ